MKLFILSTLIAISAAARLDQLENSYLPPEQGGIGANGALGNGLGPGGVGAAGNGFGVAARGPNGAPNGLGKTDDNTSNQYLPPNEGPAGIASRFQQPGSTFPGQVGQPGFGQPGFGQAGSVIPTLPGQGSSAFPTLPGQASSAFPTVPGQPGLPGQSAFPPAGVPGFGQAGAFGQTGLGQKDPLSQFPNANRQYLAPSAQSSFDNIPQQSFDEETGYHYK